MKCIFKIIAVCLATLLSTSLFAQTGRLMGTVKDSAGNPVEFASVIIERTKFLTITDAEGNYHIDSVPAGNYHVVLSMMGNKPVLNKVTIKEDETTELNINLNQKIEQLKEVTIIGSVSVNGMGYLSEVHDGIIYSGKKTEILILDSIDANTAQNNPREILGRIPGSNYSETEGGGFPSNGIALRGLRPTQSIEIQTRQNGYNIAADLYGYPETYYLPPLEALDRIEVIRGASSLQFGPQFGGIINYVTKSGPEDKPFEFTTAQTAGSYGFFNSYNSAGGTYKKWNYFAYVQYKSTLGNRPNSDVSQATGFAKIEYRASNKFKAGMEYSILRNYIHMPGGLTDEEFDKNAGASFRARNWLRSPWNILVLTSEYKVTDKTLFTFKSALNTSARDLVWKNEDGGPEQPDIIDPITAEFEAREVQRESFLSSTNELRMLTNYSIGGRNQTMAAGVRFFSGKMKRQGGGPGSSGSDFDLTLQNGGRYEYDLDFTTLNIAPFIEHTFHVGNRLSITPGFRYEYIQSTSIGYITEGETGAVISSDLAQHWDIPLIGIGVQVKTSKTTNAYANISEAYEPTNYSNLTPIGVASKIDPNMKDVSGYNTDIGWRGNFKDILNFDVGVFYMAFEDEIGIATLYDLNGDPYTYRTNVGDAVHKGIETYIEFNPFKKSTTKSKMGTVSFFNSYSYILATYVAGPYTGNYEEMAPVHIDRFGITYSIKRFSSTFLISNTSKSYADANNTLGGSDAIVGLIPGNQVMDWASTLKVKNYTIKFGVSNLADAKYFNLRTDEYPGPGIIPAMGRSVYVGFSAKF